MRDLLASFYRISDEVVREYEGHIDQVIGDGIVIYFGYLGSHEDEPVRAVRCALALQERFREFTESNDQQLHVRIGVHRGRFAVGEQSERSDLPTSAVGAASYVAARLQPLAEIGDVVISDSLKRLVGHAFQLEPLGVHTLKGIDRAMEVYRVEAAAAVPVLQIPAVPMSGRQPEINRLMGLWERCLKSEGQFLSIVGEAGLGKTRLVKMLREDIDSNENTILEVYCGVAQKNIPFAPFVQALRSRLALNDVAKEEALRRLGRRLSDLGQPETRALRLMGSLLGLHDWTEQDDPVEVSETALAKRIATMNLMVEVLKALACQSPVMLIVEDLHWADPSSLELLERWLEEMQAHRVFVVLTSRHQPPQSWQAKAGVHVLPLQRLAVEQAENLIFNCARGKLLPLSVQDQIIDKAQGVPLFLIELTRMVVEAEPPLLRELETTWEQITPVDLSSIPDTVEDALTARLDQLGPSLPVLQLAATIGDQFSAQILNILVPKQGGEVHAALDKALAMAVINKESINADLYSFSHALVKEALYRMMPEVKRRKFHAMIANLPTTDESLAGYLGIDAVGYHHFHAGHHAEAVDSWLQAGRAALSTKALQEANQHFGHALKAVAAMPATTERVEQEMAILQYRSPLLMAIEGWAAPEVGKSYHRLLEIYAQKRDDVSSYWGRFGFWAHLFVGGKLKPALAMAKQNLEAAIKLKDRSMLLGALNSTSYTYCYRGSFDFAISDAERCLAVSDPALDLEVASHFHLAPSVPAYAALAKSCWMYGQQQRASGLLWNAREYALQLNHVPSIAAAISAQIEVSAWSGDWHGVLNYVGNLMEISRNHGMQIWRAYGGMMAAKAELELEPSEAKHDSFHRWCTLFRQSGTGFDLPATSAMLCQAWLDRDQPAKALEISRQAEQLSIRNDIQLMFPELLRIRGSILQQLNRREEAIDCLERARALCYQQGASSLLERVLRDLLAAHPGAATASAWRQEHDALLQVLDPWKPCS